MQRLLILVILGLLGWYGYRQYQAHAHVLSRPVEATPQTAQPGLATPSAAQPAALPPASQYKCDGRVHCSQMTSCEEATYFLRNCPGVKMDGNNDGVPCEQQWCKR